MMSVEQSVEWEMAGETEVLGETRATVPLCAPQIPATNGLSYGTALRLS
jgi:hypothetical protein